MQRNEVSSSETAFDNIWKDISPRSYQAEIMEQAKSENLIVCLPTGSGKTFIAIMLIKELLPITAHSLKNGGKRTVLLVKTVELGQQHYETMVKHVDVKIVGIYNGSARINLQDSTRWNSEFENHRILIFTAQVFLNLLIHNRFSLDQVNLLIFDECHHATGDDPYALIMKEHYKSSQNSPRILGLTACISGQKIEPNKLQKAAKDLEIIFQARIETGSDRMEITRNSTSVEVKHQRCSNYEQRICSLDKTVMNIFKEINAFSAELGRIKKSKTDFENDPSKKMNQSNFIQLQCRTLDQLKSHLDNIIHIGYDLGLYGLLLGIESLVKYLKSSNALITITNPTEKELYDRVLKKLDCLINDHRTNLTENRKILFSDKVLRLEEYIKRNDHGQCIVFVERVYTAAFLCQVLSKILETSIKIKYLAGSKAYIDGISVSAKYQREVVEEFRKKDIHVLISTAIIEEGLDVPGCNLVIRFNKPQNFSSYLQSKGRARGKTGKSLFVLLRDENDLAVFSQNKEEYENYEYMEKILKRNFETDYFEDTSSDKDVNSLEPYRPGNGVKIGGIDAVRIIYQYCAVLGNGQILSPRFCFYPSPSNKFKCILSMPGNCPIRDDVTCENKNKKLAKQECCLKMVEKLYQKDELDKSCLPIRPDRCLVTDQSSDDDDNITEKTSIEIIERQTARFPLEDTSLSTYWHLYRISMSNNDDLGFIVPCKGTKLPIFKLYGNDDELTVEIVYLKPIDLRQYGTQLEGFCRYIFEQVFDKMNTGPESILKFNIEQSTFKLLPCLLKKSDELDCQRMASICERKNKVIQDPSQLNDQEVYYVSNATDKKFYMNISDHSLLKHTSDPWNYKRKQAETIKSYADHFEHKIPDIRIQRDNLMATVKGLKKLRINYLKNSLPETKKEKESVTIESNEPKHYPIELLRYAPLNQPDYELLYKLPSILIRISQLSYIEQLRQLLADSIHSYSLLPIDRMPIVTFGDCLTNILSPNQATALPLSCLHYDLFLANKCQFQPSSNLFFQSITRRSAAEKTDMENLEILGDCFLKLAMSMSLYHQYPLDGSGKLTSKKDKQVSNKNLHRLAMEKNLQNYLYANELKYGGKEANWIPPGYVIDEPHSERFLKQKSKRKAFADMIEALIGAFLISTDYITTIKFMKWLGLDTIPIDKDNQMMPTPSILYPGLSDTMQEVHSGIEQIFIDRRFAEIEEEIHYHFQNKAYLIAAFTHPSYYNNRLTQCYERLEYLGDAVIDFLVIRCVFVEHYNQVTPSRVTDIRHDLSNNGRLAYLFVRCKLQTKILHESLDLFHKITGYLEDDTLCPQENKASSENIDRWADSTAPKALADVFEALVGAIFLDSGCSLEIVWKIIEPLFRPYINQSVVHPNLNPIRSFSEHRGKITNEYKDVDGDFICDVNLENGTEFRGRGTNKHLAKYDACRKAMNSF